MSRKRIHKVLILLFVTFLWLPLQSETGKINYKNFSNAEKLKTYMKWHSGKEPLISAHRGGPMRDFPENALETFENALQYGPVLIECDVRLTKDDKLVMMHDSTLSRTTDGSGKVADHTLEELKKLLLKDPENKITAFRIPTFGEVLRWAKGRVVLTVDVKREVPFERIIEEIREHEAEGHAIIITYNYDQLKQVYKLAPNLMISASAKGMKGVIKLLSSGVPAENLCVFVGVYDPDLKVYETLHKKGISTILGTMHNLDNKAKARGIFVYQELYKNGADVLSTDNVPLVSKAIKKMKSGEKQ